MRANASCQLAPRRKVGPDTLSLIAETGLYDRRLATNARNMMLIVRHSYWTHEGGAGTGVYWLFSVHFAGLIAFWKKYEKHITTVKSRDFVATRILQRKMLVLSSAAVALASGETTAETTPVD